MNGIAAALLAAPAARARGAAPQTHGLAAAMAAPAAQARGAAPPRAHVRAAALVMARAAAPSRQEGTAARRVPGAAGGHLPRQVARARRAARQAGGLPRQAGGLPRQAEGVPRRQSDHPQLDILRGLAVARAKSPYEAAMARRNQIDVKAGLAKLEAAFCAATGEAGRSPGREVFLELFAGSGRVAAAWRSAGLASVHVDIADDPRLDLTHPAVIARIKAWLAEGRVAAVWLGTPCSSWSLARRGRAGRRGGPLRKVGKFIMGHPESLLRPDDEAKIKLGNDVLRSTVDIIRACIDSAIPVALENPAASRLWHGPGLVELRQHAACRGARLDFCAYGAAWRKPTKVLTWHCGPLESLQRRCKGHGGVCGRTSRPHTVLQGRSETGQMHTSAASPYPREFAIAAAQALSAAAERMRAAGRGQKRRSRQDA